MNAEQPEGPEEIDLQGMSAQQIAALFADNQQPPSVASRPPSAGDFPELGSAPSTEPPSAPVERSAAPEDRQAENPEPAATNPRPEPSSAAEAIKDLPDFESEHRGWKEKISSRRELIRQQLAGVDPVPPKSGMVLEADPNDPFIKLLRPLPQSEILALSAEVAKDDTVFYQVEKARKNQFRAHNLAALLTAVVLVLFALAVGWQFVTETLPGAKIPGWVPLDWPTDVVSGTLFVFGLLVPIGAGLALLDGLRWLLSALGGGGLKLLPRAFPGIVCAPLALLLVAQGSVLTAVVILIVYWATVAIIDLISDLSNKNGPRRRKNGA
jgi:hypothetical protein